MLDTDEQITAEAARIHQQTVVLAGHANRQPDADERR